MVSRRHTVGRSLAPVLSSRSASPGSQKFLLLERLLSYVHLRNFLLCYRSPEAKFCSGGGGVAESRGYPAHSSENVGVWSYHLMWSPTGWQRSVNSTAFAFLSRGPGSISGTEKASKHTQNHQVKYRQCPHCRSLKEQGTAHSYWQTSPAFLLLPFCPFLPSASVAM